MWCAYIHAHIFEGGGRREEREERRRRGRRRRERIGRRRKRRKQQFGESHFSLSEMATVGYPLPYAHVIWVALLRLGALKIKNRAGKK